MIAQSALDLWKWLFALDSVQIWWYVTRSAGLTAYLLLWLSTAWGLLVPSKMIDPYLQRNFTFDFHQVLSLLAVGFMLLHVVVLLFDHYAPFSVLQALVPFTSTYRPLWVGIGGIAFYLSLLVTITFYLRRRIGARAFRAIHLLSLVGYAGATLHGLFSGTDAPLAAVAWMYKISFLSIAFLTAYWLFALVQDRFYPARRIKENARQARPPRSLTSVRKVR